MIVARRADFFDVVLRSRFETSGASSSAHFDVYGFIPDVLSLAPAVRARAEQLLGLLRVRHRPDELGAALLLRRAARRDGDRRRGAVRRPSCSGSSGGCGSARRLGRALAAAGDPLAARRAAARVGPDGGAGRDDGRERLLPDDAVLLLLRVRGARAGGADRVRPAGMKVCVLTTSYPRSPEDVAGRFVADAVERVRGGGRRGGGRLAGALPPLRDRLRRRDRQQPARRALAGGAAARCSWPPTGGRPARPRATPTSCTPTGCPSGLAALAAGKPFVLQLWGTDVELARRMPGARAAGGRAGAARDLRVLGARRLGARARRARGARDPERRRHSAGRGRRGGAAAARPLRRPALAREGHPRPASRPPTGIPLVVVGDGPLREQGARRRSASSRTPSSGRTTGGRRWSPCPSRREGYGVVCAEAMAHGRPVVASAVGGLLDLVRARRDGAARAARRRGRPARGAALAARRRRAAAPDGRGRRASGRASSSRGSAPPPRRSAPTRTRSEARVAAIVLARIVFWGGAAALAWTHVGYPLAAAAGARLRPRPVRQRGRHAVGQPDRRRARRGGRDRAPRREPARARLPGRQARDRRRLRRVGRPHRRARRGDRRPRAARAADPRAARRQGRGPEPRRARDGRRDPRLLGRERDLAARRAAQARAQLRRPGRRLRLRPATYADADGTNREGAYWALRALAARAGVAARLDHRRQRPDLRGAARGLRRRRPALRPRPGVPVPDGAARPAGRLRPRGDLGREAVARPRGRVPAQGAHVRALLADHAARRGCCGTSTPST